MTNPAPCCKQCYFSRLYNTVRSCCANSPPASNGQPAAGSATWPTVKDTDWCGDGYDQVNGHYGPGGWH